MPHLGDMHDKHTNIPELARGFSDFADESTGKRACLFGPDTQIRTNRTILQIFTLLEKSRPFV